MNPRILLLFLFLPCSLFAQMQERQTGDTTQYKTLIPEDKQWLLKNVSLIANSRFALRNEFTEGEYTGTRFAMEQFRIEFRGQVHEKVYFRFRNRFTRTQEPQSLDNLSHSVDLAYVRVDINDRVSVSAGKLCADWGAYEFDLNPIDVYEYSDIIEYADNFLAGVGVGFKANDRNQLTFQLLNSRTKSFEEIYGMQPNLTESKMPLAVVANWRGNLFNGKVNTIWSYALHTEAKGTFMNYFALGNEFKVCKNASIIYDFKFSLEDLDRTSIVSLTVPDSLYAYSLAETRYTGHWLQLNYRVHPKINLSFVGMVDIARWQDDDLDPLKTDSHIRTAWGYIPTFEYYPFDDFNLRFYVNWVGRVYTYSDYSEDRFDVSNYSTGRFAVGFVTPLAVF